MARSPVPGQVKTRLTPDLSAESAAFLYSAFLRDAMLTASRVSCAEVTVFLPPEEDLDLVAALAPAGLSIVSQQSAGLGVAQPEAIAALLQRGAESVVLIGSDIPTISPDVVEQAFAALESGDTDVVLGPASDGGYYLIAVRGNHPELFSGISWSTEQVLEQTLQRARESGLRVELLQEQPDIDTINDVAALVDLLGTRPEIEATATRAALQAMRARGVALPPMPTPWSVTETTLHFQSHWRSFVEESIRTHTGDASGYSYMIAPDAVWVVPVTPEGDIVLVRQYRHPVREWVLEVPAGGLDDISPYETAVKELREEIGGVSSDLRYLGEFFGCSGSTTHRSHHFVAFDVEMGESAREHTEVMEVFAVPAELAFDMAARGEISDGQSALALMLARDTVLSRLAQARSATTSR